MKGRAVAVSEEALVRLVGLVREETGNVVPRARHGFLEEVAVRRTRAHGFLRVVDYVTALAAGRLEGEWGELVPLITVKESFFFRAPQQFGAIERHVLPGLLRARGTSRGRGRDRTLRIWSAACARGEEPATLAMILAEHEALAAWDWRILATDLDEDALASAERGLYGERAVAQVPERLRERWLARRGGLYELDPGIRRRIEYRPLNLARPPFRGLPEAPFDLVLLRNVLIYFRRPLQRRVVAEVGQRLAPGGYLFLGASETLWQIYDGLAPEDLDECFAYRHPDGTESGGPARQAPGRPAPGAEPPARPAGRRLAAPEGGRDERRRLEAEPVVADEVPAAGREEPPPSPPGGGAHGLLLAAAGKLAADRLDEAGALATEARAADPSDPAAYALEGFLHDLAGRTQEASAAYRAALYLDPALFQPRLLLADCLKRLGHPERAAHEYRQVLATLDRGEARDLVLLEDLPLPNRQRAQRKCRQALGGR
ncbi:MAG TPA: CheR family methyltransferase [Thermoanaerobaculia bacterium]